MAAVMGRARDPRHLRLWHAALQNCRRQHTLGATKMRVWALLTTTMLSTAALTTGGCPPARAEQPASHAISADHAPAANARAMDRPMRTGAGRTQAGAGQAAFEAIKRLVGKWETPMGNNKTIGDTFQLFAFGAAMLAEEWVGGQQISGRHQPRHASAVFPLDDVTGRRSLRSPTRHASC
jgi:hypothetical protein